MHATPRLTHAFTLSLRFGRAIYYPSTTGDRASVFIEQGRAEGPALAASVADEGGELLLIRPDGVIELDSRMMLHTDDGPNVYWRARGYITPEPAAAAAFARGEPLPDAPIALAPYFDTSRGPLDWMTRTIFTAHGRFGSDSAEIDVYQMNAEA